MSFILKICTNFSGLPHPGASLLMKEENGKLLATDGGQASAVLWLSAALPSHSKPAVEDPPQDRQTDRQKAIHAKCPKGWLCDCLGEGLFSWGKNHPCNHHESYQECATWNQYQKQHYKDGLSLALHRPTATAPGADSELFFLIDFSATTYPSPSPASPRGWLARSPCLVPPGGHGTAGTVPHGPAVTRTDGCYTEQEKYKPWALMA